MNRLMMGALCGVVLLGLIAPTGVLAAKHSGKVHGGSPGLRIKEGVKSGAIPRADAKQLRGEVKAFRAEKKAARAGGSISPEVRAKLKAERQRLNGEISALEGK